MSSGGQGRLAGKRALVTGASAGIGRATAMALLGEGADVFASGKGAAELESLGRECAHLHGKLHFMAGDLGAPGFAEHLCIAAGDVDIFVNNAGVLTFAPLLELTGEQVGEMFRINVLASIRMCQLMARSMAGRGGGHIVVMSSLSARNINRFSVVYGATKHAMYGIARGLRVELASSGLKVTEIAPGMVDTGIRDASTHPEVVKALNSRHYAPLSPVDVAQAVLYAVCTPPNCCPDLIELRPAFA